MGIGDAIICTAEAKHYYELYGKRCIFRRAEGGPIYYEPTVMDRNHKITAQPDHGERVVVVENVPGRRPYVIGIDSKKFHWNNDFRIEPGEIFLAPDEIEQGRAAKNRILIEPYVKDFEYSRNKQWPFWAEFVRLAKDYPLAQMTYDDRPALADAIPTKSFRHALRMIANADLVITHDGALHHACAAMNVPCITLWGGFISPVILGYGTQINIWHGDEPCGTIAECKHCKAAMAKISPEEVLDALESVYPDIVNGVHQAASHDDPDGAGIPGGHPGGLQQHRSAFALSR